MVLNDDNFLLYAMKHYTAPTCPTIEEFENDLRILTYIKKHLCREETQTHVLLNHIITLFNCFGNAALYMLFYRIDKKHWNTLITFLLYINRMPEKVPEYGIDLCDVKLDPHLVEELRKI
jgi:hypothetical protein